MFLKNRRDALEKWKQLNGDNATYYNLIVVFERAGHQEYADKVKEILCSEKVSDSEISRPLTPPFHMPPPPPELPVFPAPTQYIVVSRENAGQDSSDVPSHIEIHPGNIMVHAYCMVYTHVNANDAYTLHITHNAHYKLNVKLSIHNIIDVFSISSFAPCLPTSDCSYTYFLC